MGMLEHVETKHQIPTRARHSVGRAARGNDLVVNSDFASGQHAEITWSVPGPLWRIRDLASKNGTWVNGTRLKVGASAPLEPGMTLGFGGSDDEYRWSNSTPPAAFAIHLGTGVCVVAAEGVLRLGDDHISVDVFRGSAVSWIAVEATGSRTANDGDVITVGADRWRLQLPNTAPPTATLRTSTPSIEGLTLEITVSREEEDVSVRAAHGSSLWTVDHRNHHALLLALARERLADETLGAGDDDSRSHGWYDRGLLGNDLHVSVQTLDQYVHRARRQFAEWGIDGAHRVVERRRGSGALRLGVSRVVIHAL